MKLKRRLPLSSLRFHQAYRRLSQRAVRLSALSQTHFHSTPLLWLRFLTAIGADISSSEIPDWVSSLERVDINESQRIALEDASFVWAHAPVESSSNSPAAAATPDLVLPTTAPGSTTPPQEQRVFELKNVSVDFPIGAMSLITGPTGSGKTSLLMALLGGAKSFCSSRGFACVNLC